MRRGTNLTASAVDRTATLLSDRDRRIVDQVSRLRYLTTLQVQRLFFVDGPPDSNARRARLTLHRLSELRVLQRLERRIGGVRAGSSGQVYSLDVVGQHVASASHGRRRRPFEPSSTFTRHALAVSELYVRLIEAERSGRLELLDFEAEPSCWRSFFGLGGARAVLKPDAFVRSALGQEEHLSFVEVDCATESSTALSNKFRTYRQYWASGREQQRWGNVFPRVLWLAPSAHRIRVITDVAARQPAEAWKLFTIRPYDASISAIAPEETS